MELSIPTNPVDEIVNRAHSYVVNGDEIITRVINITPDIAQELLKRNVNNRPLRKVNLKHLKNEMVSGNWQFDGDPIRIDAEGNLLNGQHRLTAIIESGLTFPFFLISGLRSDSFKVMDTGARRSASDVLSIVGVKNAAQAGTITKFVHGIKSGKFGASIVKIDNRSLSNTDLIDYYFSLPNIADSISICGTLKSHFQHAVSGTVLGGFHFLFSEKDTDAANEFMDKLTTGIGLEADSPIYALRNKLILSKTNERYRLTHKDVIMYFILAWNKYRNGDRNKQLKAPKEFDFKIAD